jgi:transcription elongation GreA/GreB family factor
MISLKKELHQLCLDYVQSRIEAAQLAIMEAQKASNDDTKSSAGDKYETSREMAQQETNRNLGQLNEANKLRVALNQISTNGSSEKAETGSLVITDKGNFYLAVSAGILTLKNEQWFAVSPASPVGLKLKGLKAGDEFNLNNKIYLVNKVF